MNATRWIPLVLALPLAAPAQTGFVAVGRSHLRSGFALRVAGTVGDQNTQAGLEVGLSGNLLGSHIKKREEIVHSGLLLERRFIPGIPVAATGLVGGFALVSGFRDLGACDVAAFHCIGPGPLTYSWLISAGYGLGVVGAIPAGPVSVRVEARQYWLAIPTVSNFALVDFGLARRY